MIPQDAGSDAEFDIMWENTSSFGDDDLEYMQEENLKKGMQWYQRSSRSLPNNFFSKSNT